MNIINGVIKTIKSSAIFPYLGYILLALLLVGTNVFWVFKRASYKKLLKEQYSHLNLCETTKKDTALQFQQCSLKYKICGIALTQDTNQQHLKKINAEISDIDKERAALQKKTEKEKKNLSTKTIEELQKKLNGEW